MITREEARAILASMTKSESLLRHMRTVELVLEAYAEKWGEGIEVCLTQLLAQLVSLRIVLECLLVQLQIAVQVAEVVEGADHFGFVLQHRELLKRLFVILHCLALVFLDGIDRADIVLQRGDTFFVFDLFIEMKRREVVFQRAIQRTLTFVSDSQVVVRSSHSFFVAQGSGKVKGFTGVADGFHRVGVNGSAEQFIQRFYFLFALGRFQGILQAVQGVAVCLRE